MEIVRFCSYFSAVFQFFKPTFNLHTAEKGTWNGVFHLWQKPYSNENMVSFEWASVALHNHNFTNQAKVHTGFSDIYQGLNTDVWAQEDPNFKGNVAVTYIQHVFHDLLEYFCNTFLLCLRSVGHVRETWLHLMAKPRENKSFMILRSQRWRSEKSMWAGWGGVNPR